MGGATSRFAAVDEPDPAAAPAAEQPVGFEQDIKPLVRAKDRNSMKFVFDLWSRDDVANHADAILARLKNGSMPCDGVWPEEQLTLFSRWIDAGKPS